MYFWNIIIIIWLNVFLYLKTPFKSLPTKQMNKFQTKSVSLNNYTCARIICNKSRNKIKSWLIWCLKHKDKYLKWCLFDETTYMFSNITICIQNVAFDRWNCVLNCLKLCKISIRHFFKTKWHLEKFKMWNTKGTITISKRPLNFQSSYSIIQNKLHSILR